MSSDPSQHDCNLAMELRDKAEPAKLVEQQLDTIQWAEKAEMVEYVVQLGAVLAQAL
jgi:hypothetical protein